MAEIREYYTFEIENAHANSYIIVDENGDFLADGFSRVPEELTAKLNREIRDLHKRLNTDVSAMFTVHLCTNSRDFYVN